MLGREISFCEFFRVTFSANIGEQKKYSLSVCATKQRFTSLFIYVWSSALKKLLLHSPIHLKENKRKKC